MSATDFTVDDRDLRFLLFEQLRVQDLCQWEGYSDFSQEDFDMILSEAIKFAKDVLAPVNKDGDEIGCKLENGKVLVPPSHKPAYDQMAESGWLAMAGDMEYGGQGLPLSLETVICEVFTGANVAFELGPILTVGAAHLIEANCNEAIKKVVLPKLYSGEWAGSMVMTESVAGSDVGASKARAKKVDGEDFYLVDGSKVFISSGDHELTENIIHLVLARTPGTPEGTKGLSLFLVPKVRYDENGQLGEFNDVVPVAVEHKMGISGSPTVQLAFGEKGQCRGWLVGEEMQGMRLMFQMMNEARVHVGIQGGALANASYQNSLTYARERIQGNSMSDPRGPKVSIVEHPDVRRMLLTMKSVAEGVRSLLVSTAYYNDMSKKAPTEEERARGQAFVELLTPICKAYSTDQGYQMTSLGIQVYGGYGYTKDYPVEQQNRDARIGAIYEGTNGIQALDLLGRKLPMKGGKVFAEYMQLLEGLGKEASGMDSLHDMGEKFLKAVAKLSEIAGVMFEWSKAGRYYETFARAVSFLELMGDVVVGGELMKQALVAQRTLDERLKKAGVDAGDRQALSAHLKESDESKFYHNKLASTRFFIHHYMSRIYGTAEFIIDEDNSMVDFDFNE